MKILIAEDDKVLAEVLKEQFEDEGFKVTMAENGKEAMDVLKSKSNRPELMLLDLLMPVMDGFVVLKEISEDRINNLNDIPVIVLSNLGQDEEIKRAFQLGAKDYFVKSQHPVAEVIEKVKAFLEKPKEVSYKKKSDEDSFVKEAAEKEAKLKAEKEAKEKTEAEAKAKAEKEAKLKSDQEAKEKEAKEKEAKLKAEKEAREKTEKEAKEKADREAKLKSEKEAREKAEKMKKSGKSGGFFSGLFGGDKSASDKEGADKEAKEGKTRTNDLKKNIQQMPKKEERHIKVKSN